ncbi:MAG: hypothetical protein M1814_000041 [Vezdaea aestivalis]|nr:MAG: hypothetical protein M1814_000041 [Vezdaea aestivalis]
MLFNLLPLTLLASLGYAVGPTRFNCGTPSPTEELLKVHSALLKDPSRIKLGLLQAQDESRSIGIRTYFHVISAQGQPTTTNNNAISQQLSAMNQLFRPQGITFTNAGTDYTINTTWAADGDDGNMKARLRKGPYNALNLYIQPSLQGNAIGRCTLPGPFKQYPSTVLQDGCNIDSHTLPGGSYSDYNQGKTAVHEVGHWFGLLHTFEGGCSGSGDFVVDTPAEASPAFGCPTGRDTCSGGGLDPIQNFMDYTTDPCMNSFTTGQGSRMGDMYYMYRA